MMIKSRGYELEISENADVYIGVPGKGRTFKKGDEINDDIRFELEKIQIRAKELISKTEALLAPAHILNRSR